MRVGIVGAGITGLALAHELARREVEPVVLESSGRPGGVIRSGRVEGRLLEWGPQRARRVAGFDALVEELGLSDRLVLAPPGLPLYVYGAGRLRRVPFSAGAFARADLLSLPARARMALEVFTRGPDPDESVAEFFIRKLGRQAYERLAGPLYGGLYASDPADMVVGLSLGKVLREFGVRRSLLLALLARGGGIDPPAACSFDEGLQSLTDALYAANRERVRLSTPVRAVRPGTASRWAIETDGGTVEVDRVVVTCPARAAAEILIPAAPDAAGRIGRLRYNPLAVVHLHAETDLVGLGYQVSLGEDLATRGVTWNDSLFGREGVYTAYLGGAKRPEVVEEPDDRLGALAVAEFERVTGHGARVLAIEREAMPAWDRSWVALEGLETPPGIHLAAAWESRPGLPGRLAQAKRLAKSLAAEAGRP
ncbi:MAG TPA: protoporphyrinogen oxidase [Gemmatimonadota bacterium]|nr:protoporphyrinogen oxidase [Gemmatimonadota bacterium]